VDDGKGLPDRLRVYADLDIEHKTHDEQLPHEQLPYDETPPQHTEPRPSHGNLDTHIDVDVTQPTVGDGKFPDDAEIKDAAK
jgi:hypothetical protein